MFLVGVAFQQILRVRRLAEVVATCQATGSSVRGGPCHRGLQGRVWSAGFADRRPVRSHAVKPPKPYLLECVPVQFPRLDFEHHRKRLRTSAFGRRYCLLAWLSATASSMASHRYGLCQESDFVCLPPQQQPGADTFVEAENTASCVRACSSEKYVALVSVTAGRCYPLCFSAFPGFSRLFPAVPCPVSRKNVRYAAQHTTAPPLTTVLQACLKGLEAASQCLPRALQSCAQPGRYQSARCAFGESAAGCLRPSRPWPWPRVGHCRL
jgi:hypothetical protein